MPANSVIDYFERKKWTKQSLDNQQKKNPVLIMCILTNTGSGTELHSLEKTLYIYCTQCIVVLSVETIDAFVLSVYR